MIIKKLGPNERPLLLGRCPLCFSFRCDHFSPHMLPPCWATICYSHQKPNQWGQASNVNFKSLILQDKEILHFIRIW